MSSSTFAVHSLVSPIFNSPLEKLMYLAKHYQREKQKGETNVSDYLRRKEFSLFFLD